MKELLYSPKIKPEHLARKAIVYLRQSSEKQVHYNLESQRLQHEVALLTRFYHAALRYPANWVAQRCLRPTSDIRERNSDTAPKLRYTFRHAPGTQGLYEMWHSLGSRFSWGACARSCSLCPQYSDAVASKRSIRR